jgi:hypothetical protein
MAALFAEREEEELWIDVMRQVPAEINEKYMGKGF